MTGPEVLVNINYFVPEPGEGSLSLSSDTPRRLEYVIIAGAPSRPSEVVRQISAGSPTARFRPRGTIFKTSPGKSHQIGPGIEWSGLPPGADGTLPKALVGSPTTARMPTTAHRMAVVQSPPVRLPWFQTEDRSRGSNRRAGHRWYSILPPCR